MSNVNVPAGKVSPLKTIVPMALSAVGGAYGGPAGAMAGNKIGTSLVGGGMDPGAVQGKAPAATGAMARRLEATANDPQAELAKAQQALSQLPPEDQAKYGATLEAARQRAAQGG